MNRAGKGEGEESSDGLGAEETGIDGEYDGQALKKCRSEARVNA